MNVKYNKEDKLLVMEITEEIDHHTTEKIRRRADYEIQRYMPKKVLFDFSIFFFLLVKQKVKKRKIFYEPLEWNPERRI